MLEYLTPEQVAERFQVTPKTVRDWLRNGDLVGVKVGGSWRIKETDLARMVEEQRVRVLIERAARKYPETPWEEGQCDQCGESIAVPASITQRTWVCSTKCKREYDEQLATFLHRDSEEYVASQAVVIPRY